MSDKLQQAIQATRAGDTKSAQFLLTQAIQEDPNNPQSWYLLSLLVGDKEKKQAYLTKVIELDPDHAKAHEQLIAITEMAVPDTPEQEAVVEEIELEAAPVILSSDSPDLEAQDEGETMPDWMADDLPPADEETEELMVETAVGATTIAAEEEYIPDWLEGSLDDDWSSEAETAVDETVPEEETEQSEEKTEEEPKEVTAKEKKPTKAKKETSEKQLNYLLIGLVIIAIIVFIIMAYMIFNMM